MNVVFRVDASIEIGTGHVYRCLTLADALKKAGYLCHFICREHHGHLGPLIRQKNFRLTLLPVNQDENIHRESYQTWLGGDWVEDAKLTEKAIKDSNIKEVDLLIVDHYSLDNHWQKKIRKICKNIIAIDDLANRKIDADIIIDQTYERQEGDYIPWMCNTETSLLVGSRYALLRPEFYLFRKKSLPKRKTISAPPCILISLGGSDQNNVSSQILESLSELYTANELRVILVIGANNPHAQKLEKQCQLLPFQTELHIATDQICQLMIESDIAIGAAGTTSWERCALGLPTITICMANNQKKVLQGLAKNNAILPFPLSEVSNTSELKKTIENCLEKHAEISESARNVTDGLGVKRVLMHLLNEHIRDGKTLKFHAGTMKEMGKLFHWQTAPETRRFSRNPKAPTWDEHQTWYLNKLNQPDCFLHFMIIEGKEVGMLRFDPVDGSDNYEISILVAPECYRLGIAEAGLKLMRKIYPEFNFIATVLPGNLASHSLFKRLGYKQISESEYQNLSKH
ncbi:UDP-2,4-diacetamido-2,4,6-trideoxy-beta-L-altropyranose hydrolase [Endozoicomonas sp. ONNA2]|uniref:UDP-2,4-diacetamido-2,4, 6-trideoxy-beta-L-altropyranose hydrolase n=1 Tax=Endozoicomonas sp. ONNA2 TaxID=2828741 RepID=UPI002147FA99|nr:UDP-2,4-diacetamido-2,4,6-trideoxy-beta-L-altropyranose hydrolase [Endozoicomonas sp. ONNA2]